MVANSVSTTISLCFGPIPATITYGLLSMMFVKEGGNKDAPMTFALYSTVFSASLLMIGLFASLKMNGRKHESQLKDKYSGGPSSRSNYYHKTDNEHK